MFPSPTKIKTYNFKPIPSPKPAQLTFVPSPSRLVRHQCPPRNTCSISSPHKHAECTPSSPNKPLTTLLLSLPLACKIQQLILASRQIESLARGWFAGNVQKDDIERRMSALEEQYDRLREEVECELESAWVNAGFLPVDIPSFPASSKVPGTASTRPIVPSAGILPFTNSTTNNPTYTVEKDLKRKRRSETRNSLSSIKKPKPTPSPIQTHYKSDRDHDGENDKEGEMYGRSSPVVPLRPWEKKAMKKFNFGRAGRERVMEECASPRGGVYQFW